MRLKKFIKTATFLILTLVILSANTVSASTPYKTYTLNSDGDYIETQTAYNPVRTISYFDEINLSQPSDMVVFNNNIYIADTGNASIVVCDVNGNFISRLGVGVLKKPTGVFVTTEGEIIVADSEAKKVFRFSQSGELIFTYNHPTEPLYGKKTSFIPLKVVADAKDNIFVITSGNTNGIVQLSKTTGAFLGYFGANNTITTVWERISRKIFTEAQLSQMVSITPPSATNLAIDEKGLVYTITNVGSNNSVKKLNMAGENIISEEYSLKNPIDIAVGNIGNIFIATEDGFIVELNSEGTLLFAFGGIDDGSQRRGLFAAISSIAVDSNENLYVLDSGAAEIQVFSATRFSSKVHSALELYQQGKYLQSREPWLEVLNMNSFFDYANRSLGEAYYKEENYTAAMESFKLANYKHGYSDAFAEARNVWLKKYIKSILFSIFGIFVLWHIFLFINRKSTAFSGINKKITKIKENKTMSELSFALYFPKNPTDAFYGIKREGKTSVLSATILYFYFFIIYIFSKYFSGYIFGNGSLANIDLLTDIAIVFGGFALAVIGNYLICSITEGEASLKNLYMGFIYSFMPYLVLKPVVILLSHVLTENEAFIINFLNFIIYAGSLILLIIMTKELNNYSLKETVKNILLTLFTMLVILVVLFIIFVLFRQLYNFLEELLNEVIYIVRK